MLPLILNTDSARVENILALFRPKGTILGTSACESYRFMSRPANYFPWGQKLRMVQQKMYAFHFQSVGAASVSLQINESEPCD